MIQRILFLFIFIFSVVFLKAQLVKTVVPTEPVVVGTAFQVQYIVHNADDLQRVSTPQFDGFSVVAGPRIYKGYELVNGVKKEVQNIVYTLSANYTGVLTIDGATAFLTTGTVDGKDAKVVVIANPITTQKLEENVTTSTANLEESVFIKVETDKKSIYVGEPVVATFTLYSSLPSVSEVVKNPGFYGFSVVDMMGYFERKNIAKNVAGKIYETVVLRKVQLYPMQAGELEIEEMEVLNDVEVMDPKTLSTKNVKYNVSSKPVVVKVNELPVKNKPQSFNGAVGDFKITAQLHKDRYVQNEEGKLVVTVSGKGNFIQLPEPSISWPKGIDVFEVQSTQKIQQDKAPTLGVKVLEYPFVVNDTGLHSIESIQFSYFDPQTKSYQTGSINFLSFTVLPGSKKIVADVKKPKGGGYDVSFIIVLSLIVVIALFIVVKLLKRKRVAEPEEVIVESKPDYVQQIIELESNENIKESYLELQKILYQYFKEKYNPSNSILSHSYIISELKNNNINEEVIVSWNAVLNEIESAVYTNVGTQSFDLTKGKIIKLVQ